MIGLNKVSLGYGGPPLFDELDLQVEAGDRLCLLGRNGTGKSTLLKVLSGEVGPDRGEVARKTGMRISVLGQEIPEDLEGTVLSVALGGLGEKKALVEAYYALTHRLDTEDSPALLKELEDLQHRMDQAGAWDGERQVKEVLSHLDLNPEDQYRNLSGGTRRRVLLARALVSRPDLLLLDEPTNHLDIPRILWLEDYLKQGNYTLVFITHDKAFARRLATRTAELDRGKLYAYDCGFDQFFQRREEVLEAQAKAEKNQAKKLAQEEAWVRRGVKARLKRDEGRVKALIRLRAEWASRREKIGQVRMGITEGRRSGDLVVLAEGVTFSYPGADSRDVLVKNFSTLIQRGDKIGLIGPNGSGKTTLLKLILGQLQPTSGRAILGSEVAPVYFDQMRNSLDPEKTLAENLGDGYDTVEVGGKPRHVLAYLQDFLFEPDRAKVPVKILSGGEKNRLLLAKLFARPSNLLILDEPTNDLDTETLDLLEDLLVDYQGTLILVSHDRDFLNQVVTCTLVMEGEGVVGEYPGGYDDWLEEKARKERLAKEAASEKKSAVPAATGPSLPAGPKPGKLSFKEQREREQLPGIIETLEAAIPALEARLADPELYRNAASGAQKIKDLTAELEKAKAELETAYGRWMEIEEKAAGTGT